MPTNKEFNRGGQGMGQEEKEEVRGVRAAWTRAEAAKIMDGNVGMSPVPVLDYRCRIWISVMAVNQVERKAE